MNFIGAVQSFYLLAYANMLGMMAFEIFIALKKPLFHRVHFTPQRIVKKIICLLILSAIFSILHFFYGYDTALEYVPQVQAIYPNETTTAGQIYWIILMAFTTIPCVIVVLWSSFIVLILRRMFKAPHNSLSNGAMQRDPLTGATRISYSVGHVISSNSEDHSNIVKSITIGKESTATKNRINIRTTSISSTRSLSTTRQFSRRNFLTILFGLRFAALWFGSLLVSTIFIMFAMNDKNETNQRMRPNLKNMQLNETLLIFSNYSATLFGLTTKKPFLAGLSTMKKIRMIRLNIVFYSICLLGIEDMIFYLICNKRFRKASMHFLRRLCNDLFSKCNLCHK